MKKIYNIQKIKQDNNNNNNNNNNNHNNNNNNNKSHHLIKNKPTVLNFKLFKHTELKQSKQTHQTNQKK
jgi:hypothetical protein